MVSAVCSDGAPVMLGRKYSFGALVKADAPHIIITHCILHRHALATKTLPSKLAEVLKIVVECVNYVRTIALVHLIFSELCEEMGSEFEVLMYHSDIRWLPRERVLNRVFAIQVQQQLFRTTTLSTFWCQQIVTYPVIATKAVEILIPFVTTCLCEQSFSRMLDIKTKKRNRLCCKIDMRVALAKVKPRISELVSERQQQKSH
ncbi:HAT C-terminal dimerization domain [Trinorchestia longiramus]|nr:HAT C-terminal dimerization domain [Trinorchestia longiramus]